MAARPPTSILLPTTRWTATAKELADQLTDQDELLVIHDTADDPVAQREDLPDGVELVAAGEPTGCSGKANAIVAGMTTATHDRVIWSDDDFHHPPDWLTTMNADYDAHGPTSEVPYFIGQDPLSRLLEPLYASAGSLPILLLDRIWGGSVIFDRGDIDEDRFLEALGQTISDDALLMEYLDVTTVDRVRRVPIGGSIRESIERPVRWTQILRHHFPGAVAGTFLIAAAILLAAIITPITTAVALTALHLAVNEFLGVRRWTTILAYPAVFVFVPLIPYALLRRTFVWGSRRYRYHGKFDISVHPE